MNLYLQSVQKMIFISVILNLNTFSENLYSESVIFSFTSKQKEIHKNFKHTYTAHNFYS